MQTNAREEMARTVNMCALLLQQLFVSADSQVHDRRQAAMIHPPH
jgi:hypothetical protein